MRLSIVIPAHNEADCILETVTALTSVLKREEISYEILVINDNSSDETEQILIRLQSQDPCVRYINNVPPNGFGFAVRCGLENFKGDAVAVYMADASDSPEDLVLFFRELEKGYDCVFGTRWRMGGKVYDYPILKRMVNRAANLFIQIIMQIKYDDTTNAFKMYRRNVVLGLKPFLSHHFNLTVELPLKAIVRGYRYAIIPNSWTNRTTGVSKLKIKEMGSRYLFIVLYCLIEKWLSRKDYHKNRFARLEEFPVGNNNLV